ncbi:ATP-binding cassette domain-containing protein [Staphylococcus simiae]|uniref:ATP-binding cassette domain-containing protein n=1 Tax=Staphylococcus simiae TaxID=308354 RepID=UPI001A976E8D|nr:ATP-binding cassette domain-containing protein [Staphylococcus simiae]MBO1198441.1 ATP-binding cassette domain-containing protein [Staphylococcus simiae]MBO1200635.1 ATP-binding cassette domain-containing protein [Staphylococcus simiae]MBO1202906.1 ATP-binding cassette domain-containing protein [Staphylococcus simiae]MBO1210432.1 ATP-binding cassette domain-containing protein [Staphylococcus simiae]MBO1228972.1 ATP-binding cassette domain-containing protein [Staphylococcus simiae]
MLTINNLTKVWGQDKNIIEQLNVTMTAQHILICGQSGSGKSTLAKIIAGIDMDYSGQLLYNGIERNEYTTKQWMKHIQYVPQYQRDTLNGRQTVRQVLLTPLKNFGFKRQGFQQRINNVMKQCQLSKSLLQQRVDTLSGGQFQRLWIAKALICEPDILILDEATTNLDVINEEKVIEMLQQQSNIQMIIISHDAYVLQSFIGQRLDLTVREMK